MSNILQKTIGRLFLFMLFAVSLFTVNDLKASHSMGADLTYTCLPDGSYEFQLTFYRDCSGIDAPVSADININSATCGLSDFITLSPNGPGVEISPICDAQQQNSTCNGGTLQGVEEYTYTGIYTFPQACTDWNLSYSLCCRNVAITNSTSPDLYNIYVDAMLNNVDAPCNSSPQYTTPPVPYVCANQPFSYNHGAIDAEGDSLVFSLVDPLSDAVTTVPYQPGFSATYPISTNPANTFGFNTETGQITMTPSGPQIGIVAVLVEEYRNGVLIGTTVRDMQVVVINCSNLVPDVIEPDSATVTGGILDGSTFSVCAGNTLSFQMSASDDDVADVLQVLSNLANSIPGAMITTTGTNPVTIDFVWPTTFNDVGIHSFTITVTDDACPTPGTQVLGYDIIVPGVDISASDTTVCETGTQMIQLNAFPVGGVGNGTYSWTPTTGLDNPNIADPIATVTGPAVYVVDYDDGVCQVQDTIKIIYGGTVVATPEMTTICPNGSVQLLAEYNSFVNPPAPACGLYAGGCQGASTTLQVGTATTATGPGTTANEGGSPYLGYYEDGRTQILYRANELLAAGLQPGLITELAFNVTTVNSTAPYNNFTVKLGCTSDSTIGAFIPNLDIVYGGASVTPTLGWNNYVFDNNYEWDGVSNIIVEVCFDNDNYTSYDHVQYTATPYTSVAYNRVDFSSGCSLGASTFTTFRANIQFANCSPEPVMGPITYTWTPVTGLDDPNIANPVATPAQTTTYIVMANDDDCIWTDTVTVLVAPLVLDVTATSPGCSGSVGSLQVTVNTGTPPYTYDWDNGLPPVANPTNVPPGTYTVTVTDNTGCTNTGSATIQPNGVMDIAAVGQDLSCNADQSGSITLSVTGGAGPYVYDWDNAPDVQNPTGLAAGTYCVTVTDSGTCLATTCVTIGEPPLLQISSTQVEPTCGGNDGSITISANGGTPVYQYNLDGGVFQGNNVFTGLAAGPYTIGVSDSNGCITTSQVILLPSAGPVIDSITVTDETCNNSNGTITVNASGGVNPLSYSINGGTAQGTGVFTGLPAGMYDIMVTDANGCTITGQATINNLSGPSIDALNPTNPSCQNANGQIEVIVSQGTLPYEYSIDGNPSQQGNIFTGLDDGIYTITVTDADGCSSTGTVELFTADPLNVSISLNNNVSCNGGTDGSATATATGGTLSYTYIWSTGNANQTADDLPAGIHTVTVTDALGCTATADITITEPAAIVVTITADNDVTCFGGNDGSATATVNGGTPVYTYEWDASANNQTTATATNLPAGTYNFSVTDAAGCIGTASVTIGEPTAFTVNVVVDNDIDCNGNTNGSATAMPNGGTAGYTYQWDASANNQTTATATNLPAGTYTVVVTDANGCTATGTVLITEPALLSVSIVVNNDVSCNGGNDGSATATAVGGTPSYTYEWVSAGSQTSATGVSLPAGIHTVITTDANGCSNTSTVNISEPTLLTSSATATDVTCNGGSDGTATVTVNGGTLAYAYLWDPTAFNQTTALATNLLAGTYTVTVTDANGCTTTAAATVGEPAAVAITNIIIGNPSCGLPNGSIEIQASGGTGALEYSIDGGTTFQPSPIFTNQNVGTYPVVVQDASGCQVTNQAILTDPGAPVITNVGASNPTCDLPNGTISVTATGGTMPYLYSINGGTLQASNIFGGLLGGSFDILVQDDNGCEITTSVVLVEQPSPQIDSVTTVDPTCGLDEGIITIFASSGTVPLEYSVDGGTTYQASNIFDQLPAGNYTVFVRDFNGCTASFITTINSSTAPVISSIKETGTTCNDNNGSLQILAGNGTPPLEYSINNGISYQASETFTGLPDGIYFIEVLDANGCSVSAQANVAASTTVAIDNFNLTQPSCGQDNGSIEVMASGGTMPYEYSLDGITYQASNVFDDLASDIYTFIVVDDNGCTTTGMTNLNPSSTITIDNFNVINGTCGDTEGIIDIDASGGVLNYMYSIDNGLTFQTSSVFGNLPSGIYDIVVQDAQGCTDNAQATVDNSLAPLIDFVNTVDPTTCGSFDGSIQVFSSLGVAPVEYSVNNGMSYQSSPIFTGLGANTYNVVAMDAVGCSDTVIVVLADLNAPTIDNVSTVNPDCGDDNGSITITVSGGNPNYEFSIDNGQTFQGSNTFEDLPAGSYVIIVEDFLGCQTSTIPITLFNGGAPTIDNIFVTNTSCDEFNGTIQVLASGGTSPYEYSIDGGLTFQQPATFTNLEAATYDVVVQDFAGCVAMQTVIVANNGDIQLDNVIATDPSACNQEDGSLIVSASGGLPPYEFSIDNGVTYQANGFFSDLPAGVYNIVVSDVNGCMKTDMITLQSADAPLIDNVNTLLPTCGESNGTLEILASAGTPNYEYSIDGGTTFQGSNIFNNLEAGIYYIVVLDFYGCMAMETVVLNNAGAPVITNINEVDPSCGNQDGSIEIIVSGGTTLYQYSIDGGVTFQNANLFQGLGSGVYDIVVVDAEGCEETEQVILNDFGAPMINNIETVDPECSNTDGSIQIFANGGAPPVQYSIDNGLTFQASPIFTNLEANTYNIVVQDGAGCQATQQLQLGSGSAIAIDQVAIVDASCDAADGSITITVVGGQVPYEYSIDGGATTQGSGLFTGLPEGTYDLVIYDVDGCSATRTVEVNSTSAADVNILTDGPTTFCDGGSVDLSAGANFAAYDWSTGETTNVITVTTSGDYTVTVTDANGCTAIDEIEVTVAAPIELEAVDVEIVELGETVTLEVLFPDPSLTYVWEGPDGFTFTGPSFEYEGVAQGEYTFIVSATVGECTVTDTLTFEVLDSSNWTMPNAFTPNGDGLNDTFGPAVGGSLKVLEFKVFNRWGELVHDNPGTAWDGNFRGKQQGREVFVYMIVVENLEGTRESRTGDVHLLR